MNRGAWVGCRPGASALGLAAFAVGAALLVPALHADGAARAARLSFVQGQVRIAQGGQLLANPAPVNTPLFEGTEVTTAGDGQAELEFDDGAIARLAPNSSLRLAVLRGQGASSDTEMVLTGGLGYFELPGTAQPIRVRFGDSVVTANGFTVIRVDMDSPPGSLAVFSGNAHLERAGGVLTVDLRGGESITLTGADPSQYSLAGSIEPDSWDAWNSDRDQALAAEAAAQTGAANGLPESGNPAWNDLDTYGNWYNLPNQGLVWSPYEAANPDWDPYGNGSWVWTPDYGYVWASSDSWGYLPYEFGVWNDYDDFGWGWSPGLCTPWWTGGAWEANIGSAPPGYHHPRRPHPGPSRHFAGHPTQTESPAAAHPVISVSRRLPGGTAGFEARNRDLPVTIAGNRVEAMRPLAPRPRYDGHSQVDGVAMGVANRSRPAYSGTWTSGIERPASGWVFGDDHPVDAFPAGTFGGSARYPASGRSGFERGAPLGHSYSGGGSSFGRSFGSGGRVGGGGHR